MTIMDPSVEASTRHPSWPTFLFPSTSQRLIPKLHFLEPRLLIRITLRRAVSLAELHSERQGFIYTSRMHYLFVISARFIPSEALRTIRSAIRF